MVDIGIIRKKGDYAADGITLETDGISQYSVLSKLGSEGQFYYTKSNYYGTGHTVTGYMIYEKNGIDCSMPFWTGSSVKKRGSGSGL